MRLVIPPAKKIRSLGGVAKGLIGASVTVILPELCGMKQPPTCNAAVANATAAICGLCMGLMDSTCARYCSASSFKSLFAKHWDDRHILMRSIDPVTGRLKGWNVSADVALI